MKGLHLTADLYRCRCEEAWLCDAAKLQAWCMAAVEAVGLEGMEPVFRGTSGGALMGSLLLENAHVVLHAWPAERAVMLDVYVGHEGGDHSAQARGLMYALVNRFQPEWTEQRSLDRGDEE